MPYQRDPEAIIRDWRVVVTHLGRVAVGSPEAVRLLDESERLGEEYQQLALAADRATGTRLPPFPTS